MSGDIQKEINRISGLKQNKGKSPADLEKMARINVWKRQIDIESKFILIDDKKTSKKLFDDYLSNYEFDGFSEIQSLADLVYEEVLKINLQQKISTITADENSKYTPDKLIGTLHDIEQRISKLKKDLGLNKTEEDKDDLSALEQYEKRMDKYILANRNEFTFVCPDCGQPTLIRRRCGKDNFSIIKHPFFSGRFYYNRRAMALVKTGKLSKEAYAYIHSTSVQYVDWCLEHENEIPDFKNCTEEEFKEFCESVSYLQKPQIPDNI